MTLLSLIEWVAFFFLCGGGLMVCAVLAIAERVDKIRSPAHRTRLRHERYRAEQAIRSIRQQAIYDLLEAEHAHRCAYHDPGIIDTTAVEVRRGE